MVIGERNDSVSFGGSAEKTGNSPHALVSQEGTDRKSGQLTFTDQTSMLSTVGEAANAADGGVGDRTGRIARRFNGDRSSVFILLSGRPRGNLGTLLCSAMPVS